MTDFFLPEQILYHCPVVEVLKFLRPSVKHSKGAYGTINLADYDLYRTMLSEHNLVENLNVNVDIDENAKKNITDAIFSVGEQSTPSKTITVRPAKHQWITCKINNHIRKRKRYYRKFKRTANVSLWEKYKNIRNKIVLKIRKSKRDYFNKLDTVLSMETANTKLFWKTAKHVLNIGIRHSFIGNE